MWQSQEKIGLKLPFILKKLYLRGNKVFGLNFLPKNSVSTFNVLFRYHCYDVWFAFKKTCFYANSVLIMILEKLIPESQSFPLKHSELRIVWLAVEIIDLTYRSHYSKDARVYTWKTIVAVTQPWSSLASTNEFVTSWYKFIQLSVCNSIKDIRSINNKGICYCEGVARSKTEINWCSFELP